MAVQFSCSLLTHNLKSSGSKTTTTPSKLTTPPLRKNIACANEISKCVRNYPRLTNSNMPWTAWVLRTTLSASNPVAEEKRIKVARSGTGSACGLRGGWVRSRVLYSQQTHLMVSCGCWKTDTSHLTRAAPTSDSAWCAPRCEWCG